MIIGSPLSRATMAGSQTSVYQTHPENSIRVAELQPDQPHEALVCMLIARQIAEDVYEAISYVRGDPAERVFISCNGTSRSVTSNLGEALT